MAIGQGFLAKPSPTLGSLPAGLKHFPKASKLNKLFNPNTLKVSYSCMPNMAAVIRQHNGTIINSQPSASDNAGSASKCKCRVKVKCPMNGECLVQSVVTGPLSVLRTPRRATLASPLRRSSSASTRTALDAPPPVPTLHSSVELCMVFLKDQDIVFDIKWTVLRKAASYRNTMRRCNLFIAEKLEIMKADRDRSLNRRSELVSECRHENQFYLCNFPPAIPWQLRSPLYLNFDFIGFLIGYLPLVPLWIPILFR